MRKIGDFKITLDELDDIATRAARIATKGRRGEFDDAKQEALLMLLEGRFLYDATRPRWEIRSYLIRRISGQLIRDRQNANGERLKRPPTFSAMPNDLIDDGAPDPATATAEAEERRAELERIANVLPQFPPRDRLILCVILRGYTQAETARALNLTKARVSQLWGCFKKLVKEPP